MGGRGRERREGRKEQRKEVKEGVKDYHSQTREHDALYLVTIQSKELW